MKLGGYTDGVVLGSKGFVEEFKARCRGGRDPGGDRRVAGGGWPGAEWGGLSMGGRRWRDGIRAPGLTGSEGGIPEFKVSATLGLADAALLLIPRVTPGILARSEHPRSTPRVIPHPA